MTMSTSWLEMRSLEAQRGTLMDETGVTHVMVLAIGFTHPHTGEVMGVEFVFDHAQAQEIADAISEAARREH